MLVFTYIIKATLCWYDMIRHGYLIFWVFEEWISNIHTIMGTPRWMKNLCRKLVHHWFDSLILDEWSFISSVTVLVYYAALHVIPFLYYASLAICISSFLLDDFVIGSAVWCSFPEGRSNPSEQASYQREADHTCCEKNTSPGIQWNSWWHAWDIRVALSDLTI